MAAELPRRVDICPWGFWYATDTTTRSQYSGALSGGRAYSGTRGSAGYYIEHKVLLDAGTWTFTYIGDTYVNQGIITVTIDGVSVATIDSYSAGAVYSVPSTTTGIVLASAGIKTVRLEITGKNASSSGYNFLSEWYTFNRTA